MGGKLIGLLRKTSRYHQPWQVASAIVLGCACGLLPKTNLAFPILLAIIFVLPIHLSVAGFCVALFSLIGLLLEPLQGILGSALLESQRVRNWVHRIDQYPITAWLGLHNSVVIGSMAISAAASLPLFMFAHRILLIRHIEWMALQAKTRFESDFLPQASATVTASGHAAREPVEAKTEAVDSLHALGALLAEASADPLGTTSAEAALARADRTAQLVDGIVGALVAESAVASTNIKRIDESHEIESFRAYGTTIAISRATGRPAEPSINNSSILQPNHKPVVTQMQAAHLTQSVVPSQNPKVASITRLDHERNPVALANEIAARSAEIARNANDRHEEALRYLLNHLKSLKDEA